MSIVGRSKVGSVDGKLVVALNGKVAEKLDIEFGDEVIFTVDKDGNLGVENTKDKGRGRIPVGNVNLRLKSGGL